jgi:periplasmic divalent cation tolerance protein
MAMQTYFVYVTAASSEEALRIGRQVVEERLAACANVLDGMQSIYWWEGRVQEAQEVVLLLKTTETRLPKLIETIRGQHSYECPCIVALPISEGNPAYLEWIENETR